MRKIFLTREEPQKWPPLPGDLITNRPPKHGIAGLDRVKHRAQSDRRSDFQLHLGANLRQRSQMLRKYDADHGSVCTSTLNTAGKSRTIGAQLSPASAEA